MGEETGDKIYQTIASFGCRFIPDVSRTPAHNAAVASPQHSWSSCSANIQHHMHLDTDPADGKAIALRSDCNDES